MYEPAEPPHPPDTVPHRQRIAEVVRLTPLDKIAGVVIDNTPEHRAYYLHELTKHKEISIVDHTPLSKDTYLIRITKSAIN